MSRISIRKIRPSARVLKEIQEGAIFMAWQVSVQIANTVVVYSGETIEEACQQCRWDWKSRASGE